MHLHPLVQLLLVGVGGFVGSAGRYALSNAVQRIDPLGTFPYGTLAVNAMGCLVIGLLAGLADARSALEPQTRLLVMVGILGGFTTFSTFGLETLALLRNGDPLRAAVNVVGTVALCLVGVWFGYAIGNGT